MQYCKVNPRIKKSLPPAKWETKPTVEMPKVTIEMLVNLSK